MKAMLLTIAVFLLFSSSNYSQKTIIIQPGPTDGKDTYLNSAFPNDPGGTGGGLMACAWTFGGEFGIGRSLIRFDLSQIPSGTEILDARLTLFFDPDYAYGLQFGENASYIEKITENWDEMTVTWNSLPNTTNAGAVFIPKTQSSTQDLANINVTGLVSEWVLHPENNFGFIHKMAIEEIYCCTAYSSSDKINANKRPKLVITYRDCNIPVAGFSYLTQIPKVNFLDTSNSAASWFWDFGDGYFSNLQNPEHSYSAQGTYTVCLIAGDSCGFDTICKIVQVCTMPEPHFVYSAKGQTVMFRDSSIMPQSWFWNFGDGFYSDLKNPEHFFNQPGTYYVCEQVTNGCDMQTFCDSVKIVSNGVDDQAQTYGLTLYPNPAHDMVFLRMNVMAGSTASIELFTPQNKSLRKWVKEIIPGNVPVSMDISGFPTGFYFLQTKIDGVIRLNKLIIL
jgi:hypothetical protein